jgi:predicted MFS family arabinose efflux permease
MSSLAGFLGNLLAGVISQSFGNAGLLAFMALAVVVATALSFTVDYKTVAKVDQGKQEGASPFENVA